jgi:hypothetical protein
MAYIYALSDTWNAAGTTFTGIGLNVTDTASAAGSLLLDLQVGGTSAFRAAKNGAVTASNNITLNVAVADTNRLSIINSSGVAIRQNAVFGWGGATDAGGAATLALAYDAANTLAQRNGTNAQAFRVYNTYTDASNYERGELQWISNVTRWQSSAAGTGTVRNMEIVRGSTTHWAFNSSGNTFGASLLANTDNTFDIGASGASRPRNIFAGTSIFAGTTGYIGMSGRGIIGSPADSVLTLLNNGGTDFNRLQFGGTTASFPSIQRNGNELRLRLADDSGFCPVRVSQVGFNGATASFPMLSNNGTILQTKLADDSAFAPHAMQYLDVTDGITAPGAAAGRARIYVDTADGDLKVVFADGTVKTIVTDT